MTSLQTHSIIVIVSGDIEFDIDISICLRKTQVVGAVVGAAGYPHVATALDIPLDTISG
jgi:hypothetical protein